MKSLPRLTLAVLCGICGLSAASSLLAGELAGSRPNIILVLTDDQGYAQLACHGHPWLETPHLDALHARSVSFTDFHVSPTCSPTRSALMTGNHPFKNGVTHTGGGRERLAPSATTLPQHLAKAGYVSGIFGKWHLGDGPGYTPAERGFDEVFIHGSGGITQPMDAPSNNYQDPIVHHNGSFVKTTGFCTDVFFSQALGWIRDNKDKPFFAYISTNAPHGPFIAPADKREKFLGYGFKHNQQGFYGMVENIDENVGRLMTCLREWDLEEKTLVIFMSDNGTTLAGSGNGAVGKRDGVKLSAFHAGLKGGKKSPHQGGTKVPAFFSWKGKLGQGVSRKNLSAHIDLLPTLVELAGGEAPEGIDGRSMLPLLEDTSAPWPDRKLFYHIGRWSDKIGPDGSQYDKKPGKAGFAVRSARYRLINNEELYDIGNDPSETNNLYAQKPEVARTMMDAYDSWWQEVRPYMVNDGIRMTGLDSYRKTCEKQLAEGPLPAWQTPTLP
jgi:arylsulfatase A-like enzyme